MYSIKKKAVILHVTENDSWSATVVSWCQYPLFLELRKIYIVRKEKTHNNKMNVKEKLWNPKCRHERKQVFTVISVYIVFSLGKTPLHFCGRTYNEGSLSPQSFRLFSFGKRKLLLLLKEETIYLSHPLSTGFGHRSLRILP